MPYIPKDDRKKIDEYAPHAIEALSEAVRTLFPEHIRKGPCNYIISRVVLEAMKPPGGWSYHSISNAVSVFNDAATEIERRLMGPRENKAILKNGDLPSYTGNFEKKSDSRE